MVPLKLKKDMMMPTPDGLLTPTEELQARMFAVDMAKGFGTKIDDVVKDAETILTFLKGMKPDAQ